MDTKNATPATSSAPQTRAKHGYFNDGEVIDMTADVARHMLRDSSTLVAHYDALAAKAAALDALVEAAGGVVKNSTPAKWDAFRAALTAAKAAQVAK